jgi:outer membrane receptor protein involved in Fe transport
MPSVSHARDWDFNISGGTLEQVLLSLARRTDVQIVFSTELTQNRPNPGLNGRYDLDGALGQVLAGTGLAARRIDQRLIVIEENLPRDPDITDETNQPPPGNAFAEAPPPYNEIIVTASRRSQALQSVPSSVSVLTTQAIERRGVDNFEDFARLFPGVVLFQGTRNRGVFNIRGIATNVFGSNTQDPVSVYLNETPIADSFGAVVQPDLRLFDINRIEVLRGPRGTLYGSGALGGTVRIITNEPDAEKLELVSRIDVGRSKGGDWLERYDALVNVPLVEDELALRLVGYYRDEEGWVENIALGTRNTTEDWGGRLAVKWQPRDRLAVTLELFHQESDPEDGDSWNPGLGRYIRSSAIPEGRPSTLKNYHLALEYEVEGFADLLSATSYQESRTGVFTAGAVIPEFGTSLIASNDPWKTRFFTQEIRLVSNTFSRIDWVAGAVLIDRQTDVDFRIELPGLGEVIDETWSGDDLIRSEIRFNSWEMAGFGDFGYRFADGWRVFGGLRFFGTRVKYEEPLRQVFDLDSLELETLSLQNDNRDGGVTWRTGVSYEFNNDVMFYGSVSKGYRIGQVNPNQAFAGTAPQDIEIPETYAPDTTINYEIGAKTRWFRDRLLFNLAAYYIDWRNIQIDASRPSDGLSFVSNAGHAVSKGIEAEISARPVRGLNLDLAVTFQDAEITGISALDSLQSGAAIGDKLPGAVDFKVTAGVQYEWRILSGIDMHVRLDGQHVGSSQSWFSRAPGVGGPNPLFPATNEAYEIINARVGLTAARWAFSLYGENLTNNHDLILTSGVGTGNYVNSLRPRTLGIRLKFSY